MAAQYSHEGLLAEMLNEQAGQKAMKKLMTDCAAQRKYWEESLLTGRFQKT